MIATTHPHGGKLVTVKARITNPNLNKLRCTSNDWKYLPTLESVPELEDDRGDWQPEDRHKHNAIDRRHVSTRIRTRKKRIAKFDSTLGYPGEGPVRKSERRDNDPKAPREMDYCLCPQGGACLIHGHYHKVKGQDASKAKRRLKEKAKKKTCRVVYCKKDPTKHHQCSDHCHDKWQTINSIKSRNRMIKKCEQDQEASTEPETDSEESECESDVKYQEPFEIDIIGMGLEPEEDTPEDPSSSEEEETEDPENDEGLTLPSSDPAQAGDEASSPESYLELKTDYRLIYTRGYSPRDSIAQRVLSLASNIVPGLGRQPVFRLNSEDHSLLPETERLEIFQQQVYTFFGFEFYTMRRTGDVVLFENIYDSVRVGEVYADLFRVIIEEKNLMIRTAVTADGKPSSGFYAKMKQIATCHRDYSVMIGNQEVFYNTLDHAYNQFVLSGLRQQMCQPKQSNLLFRQNGPCGVTQPHGRRSGSLPWIATLLNPSFTMGALTFSTVMSFSWMAYYLFRARKPHFQWDPALSTPIRTEPTEPFLAPPLRTLGKYMLTTTVTWGSRFVGSRPRGPEVSHITIC